MARTPFYPVIGEADAIFTWLRPALVNLAFMDAICAILIYIYIAIQ